MESMKLRFPLSASDLVKRAKRNIPELGEILKNAAESLGLSKHPSEEILKNFDGYVRSVELKAYTLYMEHEKVAFEKLRDSWIGQNRLKITKILKKRGQEGIRDIINEFTDSVRELEFRTGQMRKARGGKTFERIAEILLNLAGIPCERPHKETRKVLKRIDLVSPDAQTAKETPDKSVFIATKRTLRERWKQVVPEHMKGARLYLVTIDDNIPEGKADEIKGTGMIGYVKDELKSQSHLKNKPWIRKLSDLPKDIRNTIPKFKQLDK